MPDLQALDGNWIVTDAEGVNLSAGQVTFSFSEGAVIGRGPCKGFKTQVTTEGITEGGVFQLGPLKLRGSVCAKDVMAEEGEYLRILARLSHYEIEADGTLVLSSYGAAKIRAVRAA